MRLGLFGVRNPLAICAVLLGTVAVLAAASPGPAHPTSPPWEPNVLSAGSGGVFPTQTPGFFDTSEFMIGTVRVGVVLLESDGSIDTETESWTAAERTNVQNEIQAAVDWWAGRAASFGVTLSFTVDWTYLNSPIVTGYEPINRCAVCGTGQALWIQAAMNAVGSNVAGDYFTDVRNYDNVLRNNAGRNWGYTIFVVDSSNDADNRFAADTDGQMRFAYAYLGGPFLVMTYGNDGWGIGNMDQVAAHETGHIFYALDEYDTSGCATTDRSGYLNRANDNCENGGTGAQNIMNDNFIGAGSPRIEAREMIGWRDTDGDGIEDILDTDPQTTLDAYTPNPSPDGTPTYTGSATVVALNNQNPRGPGNDVTIDTIAGVQFNVDGGAWSAASASDGAFDEAGEAFTFTTSPLSAGTHTICARATNGVGNTDPSPSCDSLTVSDTIAPTANAGADKATDEGVAVALDGSGSTDNVGVTMWEWDFDAGDGVSFSPADATGATVTHVYGDNGVYTVTLRAADAAGNTGTDTAAVMVGNKGPAVSAGGPYSVEEGSALAITGSASDAGSDDLTFTWIWGDGTPDTVTTYYNNGVSADPAQSPGGTFPFGVTQAASHIYGDNGAYTITLTVCDDDGGCTSSFAAVTVGNVNPVASAGGPYAANEGAAPVVTGTATDPGSDDLTFTWNWGDGTPDTVTTYFNNGMGPDPFPSPGGTFPFSASDMPMHVYGDNGVYTITLTIADDDGGFVLLTTTVTVANVAPAVSMQAYMYVDFTIQVAGEKWHDLTLTVYEEGVVLGSITVVRSPGSPAAQAVTLLNIRLDMTKSHWITVVYTPADDPVNGQPNGANPAWVTLSFDDGAARTLFHNFNVRHADRWTWTEDVDCLLGGHEVTFEGAGFDLGSDDLTFTWDFGDGTGAAPTTYFNDGLAPDPAPSPWGTFPFSATDLTAHTYGGAGTYVVTLTVADDDGGVTVVTLTLNQEVC